MIEIKDKKKCNGCHACYTVCPKQCIKMLFDSEGFLYPNVDSNRCIECGLCEKVCPIINQKKIVKFEKTIAYAAMNKNSIIREKSSSGGVFSLLADYVFNKNGIVFGATFNDKFLVNHIGIEEKESLYKLRGSKYVQSSIGNTFKEAKYFLDLGRVVLFTGTPCQIGGLKSYLKKEYENLICVDIICHGVPSPIIWKKYIELQVKNQLSEIENISFRSKVHGWKNFSIVFNFKNGKESITQFQKDKYMQVFLSNYTLRPSCYFCKFKDIERISDITLGDYWGIENQLPEMDDDKGTSLIFVHSQKGQKLVQELNEDLLIKIVNCKKSLIKNSAMIKSVECPRDRELFFEIVRQKGVEYTFDKYCGINIKKIIQKFIKKISSSVRRK